MSTCFQSFSVEKSTLSGEELSMISLLWGWGRGVYCVNIFSYFSMKPYCVGTH